MWEQQSLPFLDAEILKYLNVSRLNPWRGWGALEMNAGSFGSAILPLVRPLLICQNYMLGWRQLLRTNPKSVWPFFPN